MINYTTIALPNGAILRFRSFNEFSRWSNNYAVIIYNEFWEKKIIRQINNIKKKPVICHHMLD